MLAAFAVASALSPTLSSAAPAAIVHPAAKPADHLVPAMRGMLRQMREYFAPGQESTAPTPEERTAMKAVFGSERPMRIEPRSTSDKDSQARLTLPAHRYTSATTTAQWESATWLVNRSAGGTQLTVEGRLPHIAVRSPEVEMTMRDMSATMSKRRARDGLWLGSARIDIGNVTLAGDKGPPLTVTGIHASGTTAERDTRVDVDYDMGAARLTVGSEEIEALHVAYQVREIDRGLARALEDMGNQDAARALALWQRIALAGGEVRIDDLSARYKGHTARLTGRISVPGATEADFASAEQLMRKVAMRFDVAVPLGLVRELMAAMARADTDRENDVSAIDMYSAVIGKAVGGGYARIDGDIMSSTIEWREGGLLVNGKPVELPAAAKAMLAARPSLDTTPPRRLDMEDRTPDDIQAFALNGDRRALAVLCAKAAAKGASAGDEAFQWCSKAAAKWHAASQRLLAGLYERGIGVAADDAAALRWRQSAADEGDAYAAFAMAAAYRAGKSVPADPEKSRALLRQAAADGHEAALRELAALGDTVTQTPDLEQADGQGGQVLRVKGGMGAERTFRFDPAMRRELTVALSNPRQDSQWAPLQSVCVAAEGPSDTVCLTIIIKQPGDTHLTLQQVRHPVGAKAEPISTDLPLRLTVGTPYRITVFVQEDTVHMALDDTVMISEAVTFPVQTLSVFCSSADCGYRFETAELPLPPPRPAP